MGNPRRTWLSLRRNYSLSGLINWDWSSGGLAAERHIVHFFGRAALARCLHRLILFNGSGSRLLSSFPSPSSHLHHPSSTISSPSPHVTNDTTLACIVYSQQFLAPSLRDTFDSGPPQTTQFALGHLRHTPSPPSVAATTVRIETTFYSVTRRPRPVKRTTFRYSTAIREASSKTACSWRWVSTPVTRIEAYWNCMAGVWS